MCENTRLHDHILVLARSHVFAQTMCLDLWPLSNITLTCTPAYTRCIVRVFYFGTRRGDGVIRKTVGES